MIPTSFKPLPPERPGDQHAIARFLAERGATNCPPQAAAIMGEWRPGLWREAERKAERRGGKALRKQQRALKGHYPVKAIPRGAEPDHPAFVTVTRALVDAGASGVDWKGDPVGWSHRQVAILDPVSKRKPIKGWRYRSEGREIPWSAAVAFMTSAKRKKLRPKPGSRAEAAAIDALNRLAAGSREGVEISPPITSPDETQIPTLQPERLFRGRGA
jgi:hypothetical protein